MEPDRRTSKLTKLNRRAFGSAAAVSALVAFADGASPVRAESPDDSACGSQYRTGNGAWTYDVVPQWGKLPAGKQFGGTHGAISSDKAGNVYVSTQSETGVLVYEPGGSLVKTIASKACASGSSVRASPARAIRLAASVTSTCTRSSAT